MLILVKVRPTCCDLANIKLTSADQVGCGRLQLGRCCLGYGPNRRGCWRSWSRPCTQLTMLRRLCIQLKELIELACHSSVNTDE